MPIDNLQFLYNILTGKYKNTRRVPVDSQQTSFEENRQFKFYDDCSGAYPSEFLFQLEWEENF